MIGSILFFSPGVINPFQKKSFRNISGKISFDTFLFTYFFKLVFCCVFFLFTTCSQHKELKYTIASVPWVEELGNHRAIIEINKPAEAVRLSLRWRRHDPEPANKKFIIIHEASGDTIKNIYRIKVDQEECEIIFGPVIEPGEYAFYYLPFQPDPEHGFFRYGYFPPEPPPDNQWINDESTFDSASFTKLPRAYCREIQARTAFDSFYPMEIIPTISEKEQFLKLNAAEYLVFSETRENPIRMRMEIPLKWIQDKPGGPFEASAYRNEYYAFQLGLYAVKKNIKNVKILFSDLKNGHQIIPASSFTCFNTDGVDPYGNIFTIRSNVDKSMVQPYWIGLDITEDVVPGTYSGIITVVPENAQKTEISFQLHIINELLPDRGDSEPWRFSRLRWLNSTLGLDFEPVAPYTPVRFDGKNVFELLGKEIIVTETGMPNSIKAWGTEILNRPVNFSPITPYGMTLFDSTVFKLIQQAPGMVECSWQSFSKDINVINKVRVESDGYINFQMKLEALKTFNLSDFVLEIPFRQNIARYMIGMSLPGTAVPDFHKASWEGPQDSFWIGNTHAGLHCELRGSEYHGPMLSLYRPSYPDSWYNKGKGNFQVKRMSGEILASVHAGDRKLTAGENIVFEFSLIITPVKELDTKRQFTDLYYHNYPEPVPDHAAMYEGVKIINVHHANRYNPYINYPFIATEEMKEFVNQWHAEGKKVKIYYTIRELTTRVYELWALRSLGHEILMGKESTYDWLVSSGMDKGHPWLIEHLEDDYAPAWYSRLDEGENDIAIVTTSGSSRWYNYYIEGLGWLVKNINIDGLYLDDVAYDRRILKRMRKVMNREKPGCVIDLHSNNDFTKGPVIQYTEFFPYIDKLWFGEAFLYDSMSPANWLVEVSGIPFGLMGDMLEKGGNRWFGMLFGMTNRPPWSHAGVQYDPGPVWKLWDSFGIGDAKMIGFWEDNCPVRTNRTGVLVTVYLRKDRALIALGNWEKEPVKVRLHFDWNQLEMDKNMVKLSAPFIEDYQAEQYFNPDSMITVDPHKGWLLLLENSSKKIE